jgi:hypothetical protein
MTKKRMENGLVLRVARLGHTEDQTHDKGDDPDDDRVDDIVDKPDLESGLGP